MSDWLGNKRFVKTGLMAEVEMNLQLLPTATPVQVVFVGGFAVSEAAEASAKAVLAQLPRCEKQIVDALVIHYKSSAAYHMSKTWLQLHGEPLDVPVVDTEEALKPYYRLEALYLSAAASGEFGLVFWCKWDEENEDGLGIRFRNWMIEEVGDALTTVSF